MYLTLLDKRGRHFARQLESGMLFISNGSNNNGSNNGTDDELATDQQVVAIAAGASLRRVAVPTDLCAPDPGVIWVSILLLVSIFMGNTNLGHSGHGLPQTQNLEVNFLRLR